MDQPHRNHLIHLRMNQMGKQPTLENIAAAVPLELPE